MYILSMKVIIHMNLKTTKRANANMFAAFLHIFGDLLGSIAAILSGLAINFFTFDARYYFDSIASIVIVIIIFISAIRLIFSCIRTLMQSVPQHIKLHKLSKKLKKVKGVIAVHDLHVWQLIDTKVIGTVHIVCLHKSDYQVVAIKIKKIFHNFGIHSSTIQVEFINKDILQETRKACQLDCGKDECVGDVCCPIKMVPPINEDELDFILSKRKKKS